MEATSQLVVTPRAAHLRDYWKVVWEGRYTALTIFGLVVGLTVLRVSFSTPVYEASAIVEIKPEARRILPGQEQWLGAEGGGWLAEERYFNTQLDVLRSRDLAERVFKQLRLQDHPIFAGAKDPVAVFQDLIRVRPKVNTRLVTVSMTGRDPKEVREWVNTLADTYVKRNVDEAMASFRAIMDEIERGLAAFRANLGEVDIERLQTAAEAQIYLPENQQEILKQSLATYNQQLDQLNVEILSLRTELEDVERIRREGGDLLAYPRFDRDSTLQQLRAQKFALERELELLRTEKKPGHHDYKAKQAEIDRVEEEISRAIGRITDNLRTALDTAKTKEGRLREQIRRTEEQAYRVKQASSSYEIQKTDAETKRKVYDVVAETMERLQIGASLIAMNNNVSILERAVEPLRPVRPRKLLSLGIGTVLGCLLGIGSVLFLDYLDNTVRSPEDVEQYLGLNILGIVPKYRDRDSATVREAFQSLRTSVLFCSQNREKNVLLVTSAGPREGKSSTVAHLARALASAGDRVLVLDCDLRRPTQYQHMGVPREPGLTNYLLHGTPDGLGRFVQGTDTPNLHVMTCGPIPPNPPGLIGLAKFRDALAELKRTYDWVVMDSPPIATLADSVVLASLADMMVMIIKHNENDRDLIRRSVKRLRDIRANLVGAVLNSVDLERTYYGDYYYAGYKYYTSEDENRRGRRRQRAGASAGSKSKVAL